MEKFNDKFEAGKTVVQIVGQKIWLRIDKISTCRTLIGIKQKGYKRDQVSRYSNVKRPALVF